MLLLLDLRERELGTTDDGHLQLARDALAGRADLRQALAPFIDGVELVSWRFSRLDAAPSELALRNRLIERQKNRPAITELYRTAADGDGLAAYYWVAFNCTEGDREARTADALLAPLAQWRDAPAIAYRVATCTSAQRTALEELLRSEPRFREIDYWLGVAALGGLRLDEAQSHLTRAYEWRSTWPAVTALLASLHLAADEFDQALVFSDRTLLINLAIQ